LKEVKHMKTFFKKVDTRSREAMTAFLSGHFRYNTMNSWNRCTSYANCVKVHRLDLTREQLDKAWAMLDMTEVFDAIHSILQDWAAEREWRWQVGFNGRSGGYLVLYQGGMDYKNVKTAQCDVCSKLTWHKENVPCTTKGCDGTLTVLEKPRPQIVTYPGRGLDQGEDFDEWSMDSLRDRVKLVQEFDQLCDDVVAEFLRFCEEYVVVEKDIMVPKTVKVLEPEPSVV
jgi:hypothetical protein